MNLLRKTKFILASLFLAFSANSLFACSVCYGDPGSPLSKGLVSGIFVLLGVVVMVLGGIAAFFVYLSKKSATTAREVARGTMLDAAQKA